MHARSTTIMGDPQKIDSGIAFVRDEVQPMVTAMDGCLGLSMLVDRESGHCIVTSSWESEEKMRATDDSVKQARARGEEVLGGEARVEEWEVAVMHRDHQAPEGSCCRVTWLRLNHSEIDRAIGVYKAGLLPQIEKLEGFCSASLLVDRMTGRACGTVAFESRAAMDATREQAWTIRESGAREAGVDITDVVEFELVLAHLRLPELV